MKIRARDPLLQAHRAQATMPQDEALDASPEHLLSYPSLLGQGSWSTPARDSCVSSPGVTRGSTHAPNWGNGWESGYEHLKSK